MRLRESQRRSANALHPDTKNPGCSPFTPAFSKRVIPTQEESRPLATYDSKPIANSPSSYSPSGSAIWGRAELPPNGKLVPGYRERSRTRR